MPKPEWGGGARSSRPGGGPPTFDAYAHMAPSRWKDSVVTEEQVENMANRLYSDAKRRQKVGRDEKRGKGKRSARRMKSNRIAS